MGDEKDTWKVKTLDEILQEKKRRRELEERTEPKSQKNCVPCPGPQTDDREAKRNTPEEGELRDKKMEITIRNSPYIREDSTEDRGSLFVESLALDSLPNSRGEEDESLAIKPPQQMARKDKSHHRKEEKRKDKRRRRSHSAEGVAAAGKHVRPKDKDRESERRKRQWEEQDKARRDWERQKRREQARAQSRRERAPDRIPPSSPDYRDRLEQVERQRERDRKLREQQQKEQREQKERERRAEERRKEREGRREVPSHHRALPDEYGDKPKQSHRSRSPNQAPQDRPEHSSEPRRTGVKDEKPEDKDLLSDLQDISDSERKTSTGESSLGSGSGSDDEEGNGVEDGSSSLSEGENEESGSGESDQTAGVVSEDEQSEEEFEEERENGNHIPPVPESRFDHDTEESGEEEEEEAGDGDVTPQSVSHSHSATPEPEENYIPDSPPISPVELKKELPKYLPALQGCRSVEEFQCLNRIEEGTYGVVYRAKDKKTDEIVALKRLKMEKEKEGFPITSLREINTILKAQHPNIVTVREIVVGSNMDKIYIVMNYVEHDLKSLMETMKQPFLPGEVKTLMIQLLRGVRHLHDNWILHRDLKTSNLLLSHKGILKVGDFGLAREYGSPLKPYTPVVVTLWYRSPELLLGAKEYSTAVDMWSVGCIFGELLTQKPLFPGKSEIDQINKIFKDLGSPSEKIWPGYNELPAVKKMTFTEYPYNNLRKRFGALLSDQGFDLMNKFLTYCPSKRILSDEALKHEYFRETPQPIDPSMFPTWPAKSEQQRVKRGTSPRPPEGGLGYSQLGDDDLKDSGFHLTTSNQGASAVGPGFSLKF
ncbi:cyclin-dependent kinase 11B-like isoform X1 [Salvelinus namaycush]|uniref:cyclin-dependent kinase n=1 Tax=Salvelinus namaycush TaxID=8040 RepID=A0A8U1C0W4_SALNM|nr:cyclin-dependent kinase 11B-like isoform X1 [Salvelinus namaycush]XP_038864127.1 cyclin-dependent kinase 11B-like isoform X1 [Salvelinus namaycush]